MAANYRHVKFTRLVRNLTCRRHSPLCYIGVALRRPFDELWQLLVAEYGPLLSDVPRPGTPSWQSFAYWWAKTCIVEHLSPDELDVIKPLAVWEVWKQRRPEGEPLPRNSFLAVTVSLLEDKIAAATSQGARSFIDLMCVRERRHAAAPPRGFAAAPQPRSVNAIAQAAAAAAWAAADRSGASRADRRRAWWRARASAAAAARDARRRAKFAAMVADLPSTTLKLVGESLARQVADAARARLY
ncbi:MAG: hypothetical protein EBT98_06395 [Opitutaceae bacterium]|nr:hypothetical protein [Opitutaceae bacterium]